MGDAPGPGGSDSTQAASGHESLRPAEFGEDFLFTPPPEALGSLAPAAQRGGVELSTTSEFARIVRRIDALETLAHGGGEHPAPGVDTWALGGRGARRLRAMALEKDERLRVP